MLSHALFTKALIPNVLTLAGNDSSGLAGLSTDVATQRALGVHTLPIVTATTAQSPQGVISINPVSADNVGAQLQAVSSIPVAAIKIGLLGDGSQFDCIARALDSSSVPSVLDPVFSASSGGNFSSLQTIELFKQKLLPRVSLLTPNIPEAQLLTGINIRTHHDVIAATQCLRAFGVKAVFIKGGHAPANHQYEVADYFCDGEQGFWLSGPRIQTYATRGTGCALASAIASALALGYSRYDAVVIAKMAISQGLRQGYLLEQHNAERETNPTLEKDQVSKQGPVQVTHFPNQACDLPSLCYGDEPSSQQSQASFRGCNEPALGLYPVVDRAHWIAALAECDVTTVQLRVKDLSGSALEQEIKTAIAAAQDHHVRLFINDYWQLALKHGAYGVHLGQEDLCSANIAALHQAGLRLGISTHCHYEVARAMAFKPSYIACGPVYPTTSKIMPWVPHGIDGLSYWRKTLDCPLVAIGGINQQRFKDVARTGVDAIAMISAITESEDPLKTTIALVKQWKQFNSRQLHVNNAI